MNVCAFHIRFFIVETLPVHPIIEYSQFHLYQLCISLTKLEFYWETSKIHFE